MSLPSWVKLRFGPYHPPRFRVGQLVLDRRRGEVTVAGLTNAPVQWPFYRTNGGPSPVLYKGLVRAVRREAACAVAHFWGVSSSLVNHWRRALGVPRTNPGDRRVRREIHRSARFLASLRTPARRAKIAAARRGKPRPKHVLAALRKSHLGKPLTAKTRRKISAAHKRRGTRPPAAGRPWERWEDQAVRKLSPADAVKKTGRSRAAIDKRRLVLGLPDGRRKRQRKRLGR